MIRQPDTNHSLPALAANIFLPLFLSVRDLKLLHSTSNLILISIPASLFTISTASVVELKDLYYPISSFTI
jgi:hypothetical protein